MKNIVLYISVLAYSLYFIPVNSILSFLQLYEPISPAPTVPRAANSSLAFPTIPPHSLIAFGLFLRLPGYAEVLLKERKKAQCLLRLVLGVTDDGDGGLYNLSLCCI